MSLSTTLYKTVLGLALALPVVYARPQLGNALAHNYNTTTTAWLAVGTGAATTTGTASLAIGTGISSPITNDTCRSGTRWTVVPGDDCQTISIKNSVGTRELNLINNITPDCTNLILGSSMYAFPSCISQNNLLTI